VRFLQLGDGHPNDFDLLRFISMVIRENEPELIRESLYPVRQVYYALLEEAAEDVVSRRRKIGLHLPWGIHGHYLIMSDNPASRMVPAFRQDYQLGRWPGMSVPCRSPWTFARIFPNGDVQLCYKFTVGNLRQETFPEIWFGKRAEEVRAKVVAEHEHCASCDYFRFCLQGGNIDIDDVRSYFSDPMVPGVSTVDFETGMMKIDRHDPPILVQSINGRNIVRFRGEYISLPQALGPIDLTRLSQNEIECLPGVEIAKPLPEARARILALGEHPAVNA
jgi:radical SAM protein with 4Fe4S-binding SPASM domain